jgi:integrase
MAAQDKRKLTNALINSLEPKQKRYRVWDTDSPGFFVYVYPSGAKTYFQKYRAHGIAKEYKIGPAGTPALSADLARKQAIAVMGKSIVGKDPHEERKAARKKVAQDKLTTLGGFIENVYKPGFAAEKRTAYETFRMLDVQFSHLYEKPLKSISNWDLQKWKAQALEPRPGKKPFKPATINRRLATFKAVMNKAVECEVIEYNPIAKFKKLPLDTNSRIRYLSEAEEKSLRASLEARQVKKRAEREAYNRWCTARSKDTLSDLKGRFTDYLTPIVLLALNTGLRRGELFNLRWYDITQTGRLLTVEGATAKSGKTRHVPLNDEAAQVLKDWKAHSPASDGPDLVFPNPVTGERLGEIRKSWGKLLEDAEITAFRFHDLRHHFASKLVMAGVDLNTVRELLGHRDIKTTLIYAHLAPEHKAAAVALLNA